MATNITVGPRSGRLGVTGVLDPVTDAATDEASQQQTQSASSQNDFSYPFANVLESYASYSCVFTFGVLTKKEQADPANTYRKNGIQTIIFKSGGSGNQQVRTEYERNLGITTEYFIDNVEIQSTTAVTSATKQTNANIINFEVQEPYSMGVFLQTLAASVIEADPGKQSYTEAAYVLKIDFIGYDDQGNAIQLPNTTRYFPFKLNGVDFNVNAGGSVYRVTGVAWNEQGFADEVQLVKSDLDLKGETVADFLARGGDGNESLSYVLNQNERTLAEDSEERGQEGIIDEYRILFPRKEDETLPSEEVTEDNSGATRSNESNAVNVSTGTESIDPDTLKSLEEEGVLNNIGSAKIVKDAFDVGSQSFARSEVVQDEDDDGNLIFRRGNIELSSDLRTINFPKYMRIQDIVEEIILLSEYGRQFAISEPDEQGYKKWFRIESEVYEKSNTAAETKRNRAPKIYVYKVIEYLVHESRFSNPSYSPQGTSEIKRFIPKDYNYIYSGLNDDIINFDITFNTAFYQALRTELGQFSQDSRTAAASREATQPRSIYGTPDESDNPQPSLQGPTEETVLSSGIRGGTGAEEQTETAIARLFNDILVNGVDLITADMEIWGDPYYIADGGIGNYSPGQESQFVTENRTIDYRFNEPFINLNFRTPIDLGEEGSMQFPTAGSEPVAQFSGIYRVNIVVNYFQANKFTQNLSLVRIPNQETRRERVERLFPEADVDKTLNLLDILAAGTVAPAPANRPSFPQEPG